MDNERLKEIEDNFVNNPAIDKGSVQIILQECIDEIRRLNGIKTSIRPGQHIVIIANTNHHEFEFGQHCIVTEWETFDKDEEEFGVEAMSVNGGRHWFVSHADYVVKIQSESNTD